MTAAGFISILKNNMAPIPTTQERTVLRCPRCGLVQYEQKSGLCPRCGEKSDTVYPSANSNPVDKAETRRITAAVKVLPLRMKFEREIAGMSQTDLEIATGIGRATISRYEKGNFSPSIAAIEKIAIGLKITVRQLLEGSPTRFANDPFLAEIYACIGLLSPRQRGDIIEIVRSLVRSNISTGETK